MLPVAHVVVRGRLRRRAPCGDPCLLLVDGVPPERYRRPLVATNLRDSLGRLVSLALGLLHPAAQRIVIVHAHHIPFPGMHMLVRGPELARRQAASAREDLESQLAGMSNAEAHLECAIERGDPVDVVLAEAVARHADLIVLGASACTLSSMLRGRVRSKVIAATTCDVAIVGGSR